MNVEFFLVGEQRPNDSQQLGSERDNDLAVWLPSLDLLLQPPAQLTFRQLVLAVLHVDRGGALYYIGSRNSVPVA